MTRVLISGYLGFDNSGDESILQAITTSIRQSDYPIDFIVLSSNPDITAKNNNVESSQSFNLFSVLKSIKKCDIVLSGGGNLLQDKTSSRSLWYYLFIIYLGRLFGKKVMLYANGVGPLDKKINRMLVKKLINKVDIITLRESTSNGILEEMGVNKPPVYITADPVFLLEGVAKSEAMKILETEGIVSDKKLIGVSVRRWGDDKEIEKFAKICDNLIDKFNFELVFIPMQYPQDRDVCIKVTSKMKNKAHIIKNKYSSNEQIKIIGCMDLIISMRLHSLIYACIESVPMIGLLYDEKIKHYLDQMDMPYIDNIYNIDEERLTCEVDTLLKNYSTVKSNLLHTANQFKSKANLNNKYLFDLIGEHKHDRQ